MKWFMVLAAGCAVMMGGVAAAADQQVTLAVSGAV
jgi:hypothetical protein